MENRVLGVIPARYASTRFPGKPLVQIGGKSMVMRVYEQASKCREISHVIVATDDERIFSHVKEQGGEVMMTSGSHISGTSRLGEVVARLSEEQSEPFRIAVNIQGDEPFIDPAQIRQVLSLFSHPEVMIGTLVKKITDTSDLHSPNVVKAVMGDNARALWFSRQALPYLRGTDPSDWIHHHDYYRHIGMYAFRTDILTALLALTEAPAERAESLEQLRWLSHGYSIHAAFTDIETLGIDTPEDLLKLTNNA
jgi:3-deoxy-manno-octulosonate cytidylyltransferase (CMP-KDO synthetase)